MRRGKRPKARLIAKDRNVYARVGERRESDACEGAASYALNNVVQFNDTWCIGAASLAKQTTHSLQNRF